MECKSTLEISAEREHELHMQLYAMHGHIQQIIYLLLCLPQANLLCISELDALICKEKKKKPLVTLITLLLTG